MLYILAAVGTLALLIYNKRSALLLPAWMPFTPKALLILDVGGLPAVSIYRYFCIVLALGFLVRLLLRRRVAFSGFPYNKALGILIVAALVSCVLNITNSSAGVFTLISLVTDLYFPTFVFCFYASSIAYPELERLLRVYIFTYIVISIYGIVCFLIGYNPYIEFIQSTAKTGRIVAQTYVGTLRGVRAQGTISHPITYGAVIGLMLLTYVIAINNSKIKLATRYSTLLVAAAAIIVAIFMTNSRSPLILLAVALSIFAIWQNPIRSFAYVSAISGALALVFAISEPARERGLAVLNIFNPTIGEQQYGSSLAMRGGQLGASLRYFWESPIWGGGLDKVRNLVAAGTDYELYNTESAVFQVMINQGLLGLVAFFVFLLLAYKATSRSVTGNASRAFLRGMVIGYTVFIVATGVMDTMQYFLIFLAFLKYYCSAAQDDMLSAASRGAARAPGYRRASQLLRYTSERVF